MPLNTRSKSRGSNKKTSQKKRSQKKRSMSRRTLPIPKHGMLAKYGYHGVKFMPEEKRHTALKRAIKGDGYRKTIGHLVLIANYTSHSDPAAYAIFKRDQEWVSMKYKNFKLKHNL